MVLSARPSVLVIGAGSTGSAIAYDFALRGFKVTIADRGGVACETTGHNQAQLHSGARYAVIDIEAAKECIRENKILQKISPDCLEFNGGLFLELDEQKPYYRERFIEGCQICQIPVRQLTKAELFAREPNLSPNILTAFLVPEGTFDPYRLCLSFLTSAAYHGAMLLTFHEVIHIDSNLTVTFLNRITRQTSNEKFDAVVNATGPWAGKTAQLAGAAVDIEPSAGVMVTVDGRLCNHVLNILAPPDDGDIIVPQRNSCILGTTSWTVDDPDRVPIPKDHVEKIFQVAEKMIPSIRRAKIRGIMAATRPLIRTDLGGGRSTTRGFLIVDHREQGIEGFFSVIGGKTTTARLMAEKACDLVCNYLSLNVPCKTTEYELLSHRKWNLFYQSL